MQKATGYQYPASRPHRRRGQLPRYVLWLALLIAIGVAALGAALTRSPAKAVEASRAGHGVRFDGSIGHPRT